MRAASTAQVHTPGGAVLCERCDGPSAVPLACVTVITACGEHKLHMAWDLRAL